MAINENDIARFLAGQMDPADPQRVEVARFLQRLDSVYPSADAPVAQADHLAAVIDEARRVRHATALSANPATTATKLPRLAIAAIAAGVIALTGGVGVAAAMSGVFTPASSPSELAVIPVDPPSTSTPTPSPTPSAEPSEEEADDYADDQSNAQPPSRPVSKPHQDSKPKPKPTQTKSESDDHDDDGDHEDHEDEDHEDEPDEDD